MRSSLNSNESKIFKFHDFTEDEPGQKNDLDIVTHSAPYIIFRDEDLRPPLPARKEKEVVTDGSKVTEIAANPEDEEKRLKEKEEEKASFAGKIIEKAELEAEGIKSEAQAKAEKILADAGKMAEEMLTTAEKRGYDDGYGKGIFEGKNEGRSQVLKESKEKRERLYNAINEACENICEQKEEILRQNIDALTELTMAISEKIVCVSLETSGEVIKRMILDAAMPATGKQWAKVIMSAEDAEMMEGSDIDIKTELKAVSDKIELVIMDDKGPGTCLIEFPDYVIDASVVARTQNIKDIIRGADKE